MRTVNEPRLLCFYSHTGTISGAEIVLLSVLRDLDPTRYDSVLISPHGELAKSALQLGVKHVPFRETAARFTKNPIRLMQYCLQAVRQIVVLRTLFKKHQPALVHANSIRAGLIASLAAHALGLRVIWHLHDILPNNVPGLLIRKLASSFSNSVYLAVSHATAHGLAYAGDKHVVTRKISVIYNSVDSERFQPNTADRLRVRRELNLADQDVAIGAIAQITPRKRQLELLEAFAEVHAGMPSAILFFVGSGLFNDKNRRYEARLRERIEELHLGEKVRCLGSRGDVPAVLNGMDVLVQNSESEPLGMAILEAMATAKPVISTSVDGTPEVISDGSDGFLVPVDEPQELMRQLKTLYRDPVMRQRFGESGRRKVLTKFSRGEQAEHMAQFYDALLAN